MRNVLKLEIKKATRNKFFLLSVLIGCVITVFSLVYNIGVYQEYKSMLNNIQQDSSIIQNTYSNVFSVFNHWIGGELISIGTTIYFFVFPLLVAFPYGWSYCEEKKNGYVRNMVVKTGKRKYYIAKYIAVFVSGGLAMFIPLLFNFAATALVFPAVVPDVLYDTTTGIFGQSLMSYLYYSVPMLYIFFYLCIDFVFGGLIACISYAVSSFVKQKVVVVLMPLAIMLLLHFSGQFIYVSENVTYREISPLYFLRGVRIRYDASWIIILIEAAVLLLSTIAISIVWERKHEIY